MFTFVEGSLLISLSVRFDLSSFYSRFTSKQCNVCLYFQLTTHLASCREIGNCDIKVVQKQLVGPVDIIFLVCLQPEYSTQTRGAKQSNAAQRDASQKGARGWGRGWSFPLSSSLLFPALLLRAVLHYPNAWNRLHVDSMLEPVTHPARNMNNVCGIKVRRSWS